MKNSYIEQQQLAETHRNEQLALLGKSLQDEELLTADGMAAIYEQMRLLMGEDAEADGRAYGDPTAKAPQGGSAETLL